MVYNELARLETETIIEKKWERGGTKGKLIQARTSAEVNLKKKKTVLRKSKKKGENTCQKEGTDKTCISVTLVAEFPVNFHWDPISSAGGNINGKALDVTELEINPPAAKH